MKRTSLLQLTVVIVAIVIALSMFASTSLISATKGDNESNDRTVYYLDFRNATTSSYYGWGNFKLTPDGIAVNSGKFYCGALFVKVYHRKYWEMETKVKFANSTPNMTEASLLDRDGKQLNDESAIGIYDASTTGTIRHMVNHKNVVYETFKLPFTISSGQWYTLTFAFHNATVEGYVNDTLIFRAINIQASGLDYSEPHLAVFNGTATFQYLKIDEY